MLSAVSQDFQHILRTFFSKLRLSAGTYTQAYTDRTGLAKEVCLALIFIFKLYAHIKASVLVLVSVSDAAGTEVCGETVKRLV